MTATRLAMVGAGAIAAAYTDVVGGIDDLEVVAVADIRHGAAAELAARMGCPARQRPEDLFELDPDAVVLCTPPNTHPALAEQFLERGVAVLSEKPLAIGRHAASAMADAAERAGVLLTMATKFRFCDDVRLARALLDDGQIGGLRLVENAFTTDIDMTTRWNSDPAVSGGGVIIDNGTHSVDLVHFLAGPVAEVLAVEHRRPAEMAVEDAATLHLRTEDGTDATVDLSWSLDKSLPVFLRLYGTKGEVRVGWRGSDWRTNGEDWRTLGPGYAKVPAMRGALAQFCRALRGEEALETSAADGVAAARVVDACYESTRTGGWVKVADLDP
jgi:predicted dehydrogenase